MSAGPHGARGVRDGAGQEGEGAPYQPYGASAACRWSLPHSERYALQFADGHRRYITENVSPLPSAPHSTLWSLLTLAATRSHRPTFCNLIFY